MKTKEYVISIIILLLVVMWVFASFSKFLDFDTFQRQLRGGYITSSAGTLLAYFLPIVQLVIAVLLLTKRWQFIGMSLSLILLIAYTLYIIYILIWAPTIPCSCISIFRGVTWYDQLKINTLLLLINTVGMVLSIPRVKQH